MSYKTNQITSGTQYKNTTIKQLRDNLEIVIINKNLKIEDALQYAHEISPNLIYEENDTLGTINQYVLKEEYILNDNLLNNVILTNLNKNTYLRKIGGGSSGGGSITETDPVFTSAKDTDITLSANSDSRIATQKAVKAYVDAKVINAVVSNLLSLSSTPIIFTHNQNSLNPLIDFYDSTGNLLSNQDNFNIRVIDANNIELTGNSTTTNVKVIVSSGISQTFTPSVTATTNVLSVDTATNELVSTVNTIESRTNIPAPIIVNKSVITANTILSAQSTYAIYPITANSSTVAIDVTLPLSSNQKYPIYFYRNDYTPRFLANLLTQGTDKIHNISSTSSFPLNTGTSVSDTYQLIPVTNGYVIN